MLTNKIISNSLLKKYAPIKIVSIANCSTGGFFDERYPIGKREWVGYGINGRPVYQDQPEFPMPAVRFREITGDLVALREKEKGDWKNLTIEEKKKLYRISFCQTLAEEEAPTGEWKSILGLSLGLLGVTVWLWIFFKLYVCPPLPHTFSEEYRAATLRRMIDTKEGHLTGVSSHWDYEKDDWKK